MSGVQTWGEPRPLSELRAENLEEAGVVFRDGGYLYRTSGRALGHGGMGNVFEVARRPETGGGDAPGEPCVGKTFHAEYLYQLRTDEVTRRDHDAVLRNMETIRALDHPHLLPTYVSAPIRQNHLTVTPRKAETLLQAVAGSELSARRRVELLCQALRGLAELHRIGFVHRDLTLRNILVDEARESAYLFDFDLVLKLDEVAGESYKTLYRGRVFGSPGFSVAPEILDAALTDNPVSPRLDVYAAGGAIFALFTDRLPYGGTEDMWSLLLRISEGVVLGGRSLIEYPESVPLPLRPVIERCMEREPGARYPDVEHVIAALEARLEELDHREERTATYAARVIQTLRYGDQKTRVGAVFEARLDRTITRAVIDMVDRALERYGYQVRRAIGRVKGYPIFMVAPDPELVAQGRFPDFNTYPKIVTAIDLNEVADPARVVDLWLGHYLPILRKARQGLVTPLHRVVFDEPSRLLCLFSEYVDDPRFGTELEQHELALEEALGLGYLITGQVRRLHEHGLAHGNVGARSLLLKGIPQQRRVHPAMVGMVAPSFELEDKVADARRIAGLVLSWLRPRLVEEAEAVMRSRLDALRARLARIAFDEKEVRPGIDDVLEAVGDGLSAVDYNFGVLRENRGDLDAYALLLVSHSLYGRLWDR